MINTDQSLTSKLLILFFLSYLVIIFLIFEDYGISWDEPYRKIYGEDIIKYYTSLFRDKSFLDKSINVKFGGLFDSLSALVNKFSPIGEYETRHLLNALVGFGGVLFVYFFTNHLTGQKAIGFLAALFIVFSPRYFGHSFNNPKDIPFAVFYLSSIFAISKSIPFWKTGDLPTKTIWFLGLSLGCSLSIRMPGFILIGYLLVTFAIYQGICLLRKESTFKKICLSSKKNILAPCLISLGMFLVFWPYSYLFVTSPEKILVLFNEIRNFSWGYSVLFEGSHYKLQDLPWYYLLKWFYITTPLVIIVGAIMFLVSIYFSTRLKLSADQNLLESREKLFSLALILGSIFIPFVYSFFNKSILYEGVRHFLFFLPFLAIMAAWGYWNLAQLGFHFIAKSNLADSKISKLKIVLFSTMCLSLYDPIRWTVVSHPHQYLYFSEIFGGASNAYKLYDMDYYGNSLRKAALWVNKRVEPVIHGQKIIWSTNANPDQIKYYLDPKKYIYNSKEFDIFFELERWKGSIHGGQIYKVSLNEIPLNYVLVPDPLPKVQ
jgi:hypothetical protein